MRQRELVRGVALLCVSIHAPVKGATRQSALVEQHLDVSIHAPVKGATGWEQLKADIYKVSIHAPVKGATRLAHFDRTIDVFQSTHP